jgi:8-oxo-dGTP diphosphatase
MSACHDIIRVTAAILTRDHRVLIARRRPGSHQANRWEFPGGKIEPGETPPECLRRELREEFDIDVMVGEYLGSHRHRYDSGVIELMAYRVQWQGRRMILRDHGAVRWAGPDELSNYDFAPADAPFVEQIRSGEIPL